MSGAATSVWDSLTGAVSRAWGAVTRTASNVWSSVKGTAVSAWNSVSNAARSAWNSVKSGAGALWDTVSGGLSRGWDWLKQQASEVGEALGGRQRGLTPDERTYAHEVFGDVIDYDVIVVARGHGGSTGASRTLGNLIALQDGYFVDDTLDLTPQGARRSSTR